jgi:hypothetical protein
VRIREGKNPRPVAVRRLAAKKRVPAEDSGAANGGPHAVQAVPIDDFYGRTDLDLHSRCYARQGALWPSLSGVKHALIDSRIAYNLSPVYK